MLMLLAAFRTASNISNMFGVTQGHPLPLVDTAVRVTGIRSLFDPVGAKGSYPIRQAGTLPEGCNS